MSKITIDRSVVEKALEALEDVDGPITALLGGLLGSPDADAPGAKVRAAITAFRAALAKPEDEEIEALNNELREENAALKNELAFWEKYVDDIHLKINVLRAALAEPQRQTQDGVTIFQTFRGVPSRKLLELAAEGWTVAGLCIERTQADGEVSRGAVTTGGNVLWWQPDPQRQPLTTEQIAALEARRHRNLPPGFDYTEGAWYELGLRHGERAHSIGGGE